MTTKVRTLYVMKDASKDIVRPKVFLERTASGAIVCGVHVTGRTVREAREKAQAEFSELLKYAKGEMENGKGGA